LKAREGDLIETKSGLIFDVKGLIHPPDRVIAFPRFIPYEGGNRKRGKTAYCKIYSLSERFMFLKQYFPQYVLYDGVFDETLCEVPKQDIKRHYRPSERLQEIRRSSKPDRLEKAALEFFEQLRKQAKMSWDDCGISGSLLIKLHTPKSDIDPIVYGSNSCRKTYAALTNLLKSEKRSFKPYTLRELKTLFDFRSKDTMTGF
jgi:predicted nucleotidyltransferase